MEYSIRQVELNHMNQGLIRAVKDTLGIFRDAVRCLVEIISAEWDSLSGLNSRKQLTAVERLVHTTKDNRAVYPEFDQKFYKFPSYYRRSAVHAALGIVSSYRTRKAVWDKERHAAISSGKKFRKKPPVLNPDTASFPSMYRDAMYSMDGPQILLKLYIRNTWDWVEVSAASRDIRSLEHAVSEGASVSSPKMCIRNRKVYLQFPVSFPCAEFPDTPPENQRILGVDLGVNNGAVCSVVDASGTIHKRIFDPFSSERDRIFHMLNRLRRLSRMSGKEQRLSAFYSKLDGLKNNYTKQLASWIVRQAVQCGVYGIAMEYLGRMKPHGKKKDRIHHWCRQRIYALVRGMALRHGIRVFLVNPKNTSALAFDGSGPVKRDEHNFSLCTFATGKRYHCDLGASYNISARYFIRAFCKSMPETAWSRCVAEVPALAERTSCTLSNLWKLSRYLHPAAKAA